MDKKAKSAIAAVAAISAAVGAGFLVKKVGSFFKEDRCKECGKKVDKELFTQYEPEDIAYLSKDVIEPRFFEKGKVCEECYDSIYREGIEKYDVALEDARNVKVYFKEFQGEVGYSEEVKKVSTECYDSKDEVIQSLKTMASYINCDVVFDVEFSTEVINDGPSKRVMYKGKGILAKSN